MEFHMDEFYRTHGIEHQMSVVYTPQQNGRVERKHQHLLNVARALKVQSGLPLAYWSDFVLHAAYLINRIPTPVLNNLSPYEKLYGVPPDYSSLKVFGCLVYASTAGPHRTKFSPRAKQCVFLGIPDGIKGFKLLDIDTKRVFCSRDVIFHENILPYANHSSSPSSLPSPIPTTSPTFSFFPTPSSIPNPNTSDSSSSSSDVPTPVNPQSEGGTQPPSPSPKSPIPFVIPSSPPSSSPDFSFSHQTHPDDSKNTPNTPSPSHTPSPFSPIPLNSPAHSPSHVQLRRLTRTVKPPNWHADYHVTHPIHRALSYTHLLPKHQHFINSLTSHKEPSSYQEAMQNPLWDKAVQEELKALIDNGTWEIKDLPVGKKAIGCKWVFRLKLHSDGSIERYKARLVAKGYTQVYGIDYCDTFSPVAKLSSVKTLLAVAALQNWHLHQMDVSNAFLNGDLTEEVYMEIPDGLDLGTDYKGKVCHLKKSLYGLKQASRQWYTKLTESLLKHGFKQSSSDYSIFTAEIFGALVVLIVYVDDILIGSVNLDSITETKRILQGEFKMKDLGELKYFLGLEVTRGVKGITVSQRKYCLELLTESGFENCKPASTPIYVKEVLSATGGIPLADVASYKHYVGQLQYLTTIRPDIAFAVQQLCTYQDNPTSLHLRALHRVLRYLKGAPGQGLLYSKDTKLELKGFSDSDRATCPDTRKSITGYCTFLGSGIVTWKSKKQKTVSRSSSEVEYRALASLSCEVEWLIRLFKDFGVEHPQAVKVFCDNQSAIHIAENPVFHERTKHIDVDCHVIRERVQSGLIALHHVSTDSQPADIFTKSLSVDRFASLLSKLGVYDIYSPACGRVIERRDDQPPGDPSCSTATKVCSSAPEMKNKTKNNEQSKTTASCFKCSQERWHFPPTTFSSDLTVDSTRV
ncbi:unnamed protein product [Linum trigynum]|uniref:Integrase catalytic domain-containing protein n=1 Tax=Linum trigynum TaxID=586398 RepID=A0AAV2GRF2_9ROSI